MAQSKLILAGLKEILAKGPAEYKGLELETPLVWAIPDFFQDHMYKFDLEKLVRNKHTEVRNSVIEKVGIFLLEIMVEYFSKTLLEKSDLEQRFADVVQLIADICGALDSSGEFGCPAMLKSELTFVVISTKYALDLLSPTFDMNNEPPKNPEGNLHIRGIKAWYYMSTFEHNKALRLFEKILQDKENVAVYGYWYGKTLGRARRQIGNYDVSKVEVEMLMSGVSCKSNIPTILMSLKEKLQDGEEIPEMSQKVEELMELAWESRGEYTSTNLTRIAITFWNRKDNAKARELFDMAIKLDPESAMALHKYGVFLMDQDSDISKAAEMLIRANHMPAFLTLIRRLHENPDNLSIQTCFEKIEENATNISHPIRYILFRYHWSKGMNAKASFHLKILYTECKHTFIAISRSDYMRKKMQEVLQMSQSIPWEINISKDCQKFRSICSEFDEWLKDRMNSYTTYTL